MAWFINAIMAGVLIELQCPRCGRVQHRARKPKGQAYSCKFCHAPFKREEAEKRQKDIPR